MWKWNRRHLDWQAALRSSVSRTLKKMQATASSKHQGSLAYVHALKHAIKFSSISSRSSLEDLSGYIVGKFPLWGTVSHLVQRRHFRKSTIVTIVDTSQ